MTPSRRRLRRRRITRNKMLRPRGATLVSEVRRGENARAMSSVPMFPEVPGLLRGRWIISRRDDLLWFVGGSLAGYLLFYLHAGLKLDMIVVWFAWVTLLDTPHFFGTYSRTYLDKVEWARRKWLLIGSLGWFLIGPAVVGASAILFHAGIRLYQLPLAVFVVIVTIWSYLHVVRQHFGITRLYSRKNDETHPADRRLDWMLIHVALMAPLAAFAVRHPEVRSMLGLPPGDAAWPGWNLATMTWDQAVVVASLATVLAVVGLFAARQVQLLRAGTGLNFPKLLFLTAVIPFYSFICFSPASSSVPILAFGAFVTLSHDFQYHALVWFHHRNRYHRQPGADVSAFGLAPRISANLLTFFGCALAMSLVLRFLGCSLELTPGCNPIVLTSHWLLFGQITSRELLIAFIAGFQMHHYFLDQFIWRPSQDENLARDLNLRFDSIR